MRRGWRALAGLVLGALLGGSGPCAAAPPGGRIVLHECRLEHPLKVSSIDARCGTLRVPLDRGSSGGPAVVLRVSVVPALNRRALRAPVFLLAGGPGQGATAMYLALAPAFARTNREHDIVLVDQRGTGGSAPLDCDYGEDWRDEDADVSKLREVTTQCLSKYGARVRFYTSSIAVADLDAVREALGYSNIDLYGASYGTRVAQLYMRRYPGSTKAVILDGVTAPEEAIGPETPLYAERALASIVARCGANDSCAAAYPRLQEELELLRGRFGPQKLALSIDDPSSGLPLAIQFNRAILNASLRFLSYNATEASLLPTLIHRGAQGALAPLAAQTVLTARAVRNQLASGMQNTVICSEDAPLFAAAGIDPAAIRKTYLGADQLDAFRAVCGIWPRGPVDADLHAPLVSGVPTLLLSGEADPVTPPADAERAARGLAHHLHVVLPGEGHGQAATGCVPALMARFLDDESPEKLDTSCLERHRPAPFFVSSNGPAP